MSARVNMNPQAYMLRLNTHLGKNLDRAAVHVWRYVLKSFNNFGTAGLQKRTRSGHSTKNKDHVPSAPGDPPNKKSGWLKKNVGYDKGTSSTGNNLQRRIGTGIGSKESVNYALALELGTTSAGRGNTTTILPRPYLLPAIKNNLRIINAYLTRPMR